MRFITEIRESPLGTAFPVRTADVAIDVFPDGRMEVGLADKPDLGSLFQFTYQPVLVACADGFMPEIGSIPGSAYVDGKPADGGFRYFDRDDRKYRAEVHDHDDAEIYHVAVCEIVPGSTPMVSYIVGLMHEVNFVLEHEITAHGYERGLRRA